MIAARPIAAFLASDDDGIPAFDVPHLRRYWSDARYAAQVDAEQADHRALAHAHFDAVRDRGLARRDALETVSGDNEC